jgi:large subunit ribosomal protein L7/L12
MGNEKLAGILEDIKGLTILELNELVKMMEDEFGVSAAAMAVAALTSF